MNSAAPVTGHDTREQSATRFIFKQFVFTRSVFTRFVCSLVTLAFFLPLSHAQQQQPPAPPAQQEDEQIRVTTEEVLVPLLARDEGDRFDPTLEPEEILVLEDGIAQRVTSVRRLPASVLVVLDTTGTENLAMRTSTTRAAARAILSRLNPGDRVALLEQGTRVRPLQDWTSERATIDRALARQLSSGNAAKSARFTEAMIEAARMFEGEPRGNRHVVFITDGVEGFDGKGENVDQTRFALARERLAATGALVHVVSYTRLKPEQSTITEADKGAQPVYAPPRTSSGVPDTVALGGDTTRPVAGDPRRGGSPDGRNAGVFSITFDPAMKRRRNAFRSALKKSESRLASLTEAVGGELWLPVSADEMIEQSRRLAGEIAAHYTVTYKPKRLFAPGERRRLEVVSRRVGLRLQTKRRYATIPPPD